MTNGTGPSAASPVPGLHARVLDALGRLITTGELAPGAPLTIDDIERQHGVSRSVARETIRVLESMRLVAARRRVGVIVLPVSEWNLYDPQVIRWRLASDDRLDQLNALLELRLAIEPEAARLAAGRASSAEIAELVNLAGQLWAAGQDGDGPRFLALDVEFHAHVLECSANPMFARLESLVGQALVGRTEEGLIPAKPATELLEQHVDVARAIRRRDADAAYTAMRTVLLSTASELGRLGG